MSLSKLNVNVNQFITDPTVLGQGTWFCMHRMAKNAITKITKDGFIAFLDDLRYTFPCKKCRRHINQYLTDHPIKDYYNIVDEHGNDIGMFKYSWMFHNAVNTRLGKPYVDWETAWKMYEDPSSLPCNLACEDDDSDDANSTVNVIKPTLLNNTVVSKGNSNKSVPSSLSGNLVIKPNRIDTSQVTFK
jgi:hypothetical protein